MQAETKLYVGMRIGMRACLLGRIMPIKSSKEVIKPLEKTGRRDNAGDDANE
jgi:hypothetical protein